MTWAALKKLQAQAAAELDALRTAILDRAFKAKLQKTMEPIFFNSDTTYRWSCRLGDYLFWFRFNIFAGENQLPKVVGMWAVKDGNFVTITNRWQDLPPWFELNPLETSGSLIYRMQEKLDSGYEPSDPVEGPNLWRVFAGDRLTWVGPSRPDLKDDYGVLALLDFRENALVIGEPFDFSSGSPIFGELGQVTPEDAQRCRNGLLAASSLGIPRVIAAEDRWRLG